MQWRLKSFIKVYTNTAKCHANLDEICKYVCSKYNLPASINWTLDHEKITFSIDTFSENKNLPIIAAVEICAQKLGNIEIKKREISFACSEKKEKT